MTLVLVRSTARANSTLALLQCGPDTSDCHFELLLDEARFQPKRGADRALKVKRRTRRGQGGERHESIADSRRRARDASDDLPRGARSPKGEHDAWGRWAWWAARSPKGEHGPVGAVNYRRVGGPYSVVR